MLDSAIAAYIEMLGEREFDIPLRALLRAEGFYDIEHVHGVSEFGRDFIAKRRNADGVACQYSFQSKAGDLAIADWRKVREQLEDIRTIPFSHPSFDSTLDGVSVLVTTGRLKGDARAAAAGYGDTLPSPWRFELWTGERLLSRLKQHLHAAIGDRARGPLLSLLGAIDEGTVDLQMLERHTRRWIPEIGRTVAPDDVMEAGLVASRLQAAERLDLAVSCSLGVLRAQLAAHAEADPLDDAGSAEIQAAGEFFEYYATALWSRCDESLTRPRAMLASHPEFGFWVTYPVRCMRLAEHIGLLGLWRRRSGHDVRDIADWLARFLSLQPGSAHPISDRHAVSFFAPSLLLSDRPELLTTWLREAVRWTADRYEGEALGLAGVDARPAEEVEYLLGDLEHVTLSRRRESLVAGALLDLASVLELADLYDDARHEFHAVEVVPVLRYPPEGRDAWLRGDGVRQEHNAPFLERFADADGWQTAPHQGSSMPAMSLRAGLELEALAVWGLLRDRWDARLLRELCGGN